MEEQGLEPLGIHHGLSHSYYRADPGFNQSTLKRFGTAPTPAHFYYDKTHGIIVMRKYPKYDSFEDQADAMGQMIQRLIFAVTKVRCQDIHTENVRKRRMNHDQSTLIDLGY